MKYTESYLVNQTYGKLIPIKLLKKIKKGNHTWLLHCSCGKTTTTNIYDVIFGKTSSCGCAGLEQIRRDFVKPDSEGAFNKIKSNYIGNCKKRNINFMLTQLEFRELILQNCHYCNSPPSNVVKFKNGEVQLKYNGIDRKHNKLDYTSENSVTCCIICNRAKNNMSYFDFMVYINRIKGVNQ